MTPFAVRMIISCHTSPRPERDMGEDMWNSECGKSTLSDFIGWGLVDPIDFKTTERGAAWVKFICQTPLPEMSWTLPERQMGRQGT